MKTKNLIDFILAFSVLLLPVNMTEKDFSEYLKLFKVRLNIIQFKNRMNDLDTEEIFTLGKGAELPEDFEKAIEVIKKTPYNPEAMKLSKVAADWGKKLRQEFGSPLVTLIIIKVQTNEMIWYNGKKILWKTTVAVGDEFINKATLTGEYRVINKVDHFVYQWDNGLKIFYGCELNSFGSRVMALDKNNYAIHGTNDLRAIGKHISLGCIRLTNIEAFVLYELVDCSTKVSIK